MDVPRAAAILYGDWGTSKAYVIGLAFAVGGYASFWLIAAMCVLTALVGINYIVVCRLYPEGGGVYASVRNRSEVISIVGAFLLIADYLVTAAISSLSAFHYLGVPHPEKFAAAAILAIGLLNLLGPKHTGGLAFLISVPTAIVVLVLAAFSIPHLGAAIGNLQPLQGTFWHNWNGFVAIVLALSGVEAIANSTGVMRLNPGSTEANPSVTKTSTPALLWVMVEVCIFTALLGLAMHALPGLHGVQNGEVNAPGASGVRDYMLRYMGQTFVGGALGVPFGHIFAVAVSIVFGCLLLSAVNTSIVALITIQFLMARDREMPRIFERLNKWGVPGFGLFLATVVPMALVVFVRDIAGLAELYAVGVVGAIATNLGATATDRTKKMKRWERTLMFATFIVMAAIEISLLIDKPNARYFVATILAVALILRGLVQESRMKKEAALAPTLLPEQISPPAGAAADLVSGEAMLCAIRGTGRTLDFALREARETGRRLYLLFVREQSFMTEQDVKRKWQEDPEARVIFENARARSPDQPPLFCYAVSDSASQTIVDIAATLGASRLILGAPRRHAMVNILRGNLVREVSDMLPEEIDLLVYA